MTVQSLLLESTGRDMCFKVACYIARLTHVTSTDTDLQTKSKVLGDRIADTRTLINVFRYIVSFREVLRFVKTVDVRTVTAEECTGFLCVGFRACEQLSGDISYARRYELTTSPTLAPARLSWHYKFYKSWSLLFGAITEVLKVRKLKAALRVAVAKARSENDGLRCTALVKEFQSKVFQSFVTVFRCCCDMIIYFQWIESYNPNIKLAHLCGLFSGICGVYQCVVAPPRG
eukprot:PhF_6_TR3358/c0_g1_i3/m.4772